ncbi:hypothetical protein KL86DYS1_11307 [uncultured Dysgonomonas sp.]|uniref:Uncharacterized protein n=1 Tax=uncultured Dysgonomonas sp. TaxID=206096 RepID=A0A212J7D2_9BACT|nr:hypothetical protein KL86DYS1_11307 [uncultured Dysgonomonas sp.]
MMYFDKRSKYDNRRNCIKSVTFVTFYTLVKQVENIQLFLTNMCCYLIDIPVTFVTFYFYQ